MIRCFRVYTGDFRYSSDQMDRLIPVPFNISQKNLSSIKYHSKLDLTWGNSITLAIL